MKLLKSFILFLGFCLLSQVAIAAPSDKDKAVEFFKEYLNDMVQRVEKVEDPLYKRKIINTTLDRMLTTFEQVSDMEMSDSDREAITILQDNLQDKKDELNGNNGYNQIPAKDLNNFANYIQQDLEQADRVVISVSATLLAIILVLLLAL